MSFDVIAQELSFTSTNYFNVQLTISSNVYFPIIYILGCNNFYLQHVVAKSL